MGKTKFSIRDFKRIEKADIELEGITLVVGANSGGKSTLTKAIKAVLSNATSERQYRYGTKSFTVGIGYDGHAVEFQRKGAETASLDYSKPDGTKETLSKLGKDSLSVIVPDFPVRREKIGDVLFYPNIISQGEVPIFGVVDTTDLFSTLYEDVAKLTDRLASLKKNLTHSNREVLDYEAQVKFCESGIADAEAKLVKMNQAEIEKFIPSFEAHKDLFEASAVAETSTARLKYDLAKFQKLIVLQELVQRSGSTWEHFLMILDRFNRVSGHASQVKVSKDAILAVQQRVARYDSFLAQFPNTGDSFNRLKTTLRLYLVMEDSKSQIEEVNRKLTSSEEVLSKSDYSGLDAIIRRVQASTRSVSAVAQTRIGLTPVMAKLVALDTVDVVKMTSRLALLTEVYKNRDAVAAQNQKIEDLVLQAGDVVQSLSAVELCPLCVTEVNIKEDFHVH